MTTIRLTLALCLLPLPVLAHPGHLTSLAGHDHWIAGAAIAAGVILAGWGLLKGRKDGAEQQAGDGEQADGDDQPQEAGA